MFDQGSGTPVKVNGEELVVVREDNIIALVS
jgi:co-chaperonin GroES (HSP10)